MLTAHIAGYRAVGRDIPACDVPNYPLASRHPRFGDHAPFTARGRIPLAPRTSIRPTDLLRLPTATLSGMLSPQSRAIVAKVLHIDVGCTGFPAAQPPQRPIDRVSTKLGSAGQHLRDDLVTQERVCASLLPNSGHGAQSLITDGGALDSHPRTAWCERDDPTGPSTSAAWFALCKVWLPKQQGCKPRLCW